MIFRVKTYNFVLSVLHTYLLLNFYNQFPSEFLKQVLYWLVFISSPLLDWDKTDFADKTRYFLPFVLEPGSSLEKKYQVGRLLLFCLLFWSCLGPSAINLKHPVALEDPQSKHCRQTAFCLGDIFCEACMSLIIGKCHIKIQVAESLGKLKILAYKT